MKWAVVSRRTCAEVSNETGLTDLLIIGKGISSREQMPSSLAAACLQSYAPTIGMHIGRRGFTVRRAVYARLPYRAERAAATGRPCVRQQEHQRSGLPQTDHLPERVVLHHLPMSALRKLIKDYTLICESYHNAIRTASPSQIEAIDMGRRGLHNEAAEVLSEALGDKIKVDVETARRLFTLVCALHVRG